MSLTPPSPTRNTESAKNRDRFRALWKELGIAVGPGGNRSYRCPFHDDQHPSLSIHADRCLWNCFGCGAKGGVRALAERVYGFQSLAGYDPSSYVATTDLRSVPKVRSGKWTSVPQTDLTAGEHAFMRAFELSHDCTRERSSLCGVLVAVELPDGKVTLVEMPCKSRRCSRCHPKVIAKDLVRNAKHLDASCYRIVVNDGKDYRALTKRIKRRGGGGFRIPAASGQVVVWNSHEGELVTDPVSQLEEDLEHQPYCDDENKMDRRYKRHFGSWIEHNLPVAKFFQRAVALTRNFLSHDLVEGLLKQRFGNAFRMARSDTGHRKYHLPEEVTMDAVLTAMHHLGPVQYRAQEVSFIRSWRGARRRLQEQEARAAA